MSDFYVYWKDKYLRPGCGPGETVVHAQAGPTNLTVSEAHGHGMIIVAYMAGRDPEALHLFDGLVRYHHAHPSRLTSGLMAWRQSEGCVDTGSVSAATDGDLDIAYAYLLADRQWGSCHGLDYRAHARWVMSAISARELHGRGIYPLLGDWVTSADAQHYAGARVSDFMGSHFRAFAALSDDPVWLGLLDNTYWIAETLQLTAAPKTGLLPAFAEHLERGRPRPAKPGFLTGPGDGSFAGSACRIPLRMGTDFVLSGDPRARRIATRLSEFSSRASQGNPRALRDAYHLDGTPMVDRATMACSAPLAVAAMTDPDGQAWLDALWNHVASRAPEGYYEDTLKMLSLLVLSGNWWAPEKLSPACSGETP